MFNRKVDKKILILGLSMFIYACKSTKSNEITNNYPENRSTSSQVPPGTIHLKDNLYIDKTPVTNQMFMEFLKSITNFWSMEKHDAIQKSSNYGFKGSEIEEKLLKDIPQLKLENTSNLKIGKNLVFDDYINDHHYDYHPVVQISKAQAQFFCLWRTDMVMLNYSYKSETPAQRRKFPSRVNYRLPTVQEMKNAVAKFQPEKIEVMEPEMGTIQLREKLREIDSMVLFNISEHTLDKKAYGINWRNSNIQESQNDYTGFRCICEIKN
ncbi:SUMF1/EgtB/PvdO family nonheme iron enzyme [Zunongwangia sp. F363]|uniref:SUMF1/EgtB/PvdO family nonheme iron enzyme n=1 Tax=Autumnicola tepida TaxID=3075595 RepID=A0ABU3CCM7_9FLAO|nr:SUMF1/EgtB/PvdO family nonheme iron enzyme [Zunongwangia sp. F363]MDT0643977.1 SUMF1/EgtB/PvdO family nonheme iron enzyme [Zunongwangia sp. F363]